jgi:UPF0755 protein
LIQKICFYLLRFGFVCFLTAHFLWYLIRHTVWWRLLTFALLPAAIIYYAFFRPLPDDYAPRDFVTVNIPFGATFRQVSDSLQEVNLLEHEAVFLVLGKISRKERNIRAGMFEIPRGLSSWQLLNYLETAPAMQIKVTFPEGILSTQMAGILQEKIGIDTSLFVSLVHDSAFAQTLMGESSLEGYLLPETYFFEWKMPETQIIQRMAANTRQIFEADTIRDRLSQLNRTPLEIITLASIIEGEVMVDSERVYISSLYHNRLRLGWPLQADPTIQYIIPGPPRRLLHRDLEIDSPYNTYKHTGLPPGPINNPGRESILAALYPANTSYLYMVAMGDGRHKFSKSLKEHNFWHAKYNEYRRQVRREQRQKK